ncbi:hypothetical protein BU24DRAFT_185282 [Aaosphaeria arxii CBS 175.79]|uniref:Uncharacterized protein n=1 Tax=Aaosphaeria arxii CBS 175.79 TaxID=1450172 RepID=A0A6A5XSA2_9PLEO|nr:uncharacterized protein BU24DRAFT_185282 [Aaosphaeria arxii CBS 175.79]KAF2015789.1 hypothetical protein BU24DRAFT_185282 [Aaosphaeria arxii CBS 175.79]
MMLARPSRSKTFPLAAPSQTLPNVSEQPLSVDFIDNHRFDFPTRGAGDMRSFDAARQEYLPNLAIQTLTAKPPSLENEDFPELQQSNEVLCAAIQDLEKAKTGKNNALAKFDPFGNHSWSDVLTVAQEAQNKYTERDASKITHAFRKLQEHSTSMKPFLDLLPDGMYKPLCGGLKLMLTAMIKNAEMREKMADLFSVLPLKLKNTEDYAKLYPGENSLRECTRKLYVKILEAITVMVRWYNATVMKRGLGSVFRNDRYVRELDDRIRDISTAQRSFDDEIKKYHHLQTAAVGTVVCQTSDDVTLIGRKLWNMNDDLLDMKTDVTRVTNNVMHVLQDFNKQATWIKERDSIRLELEEKNAHQRHLQEEIERLQAQLDEKCIRPSQLARRLQLNLPKDAYLKDFADTSAATRKSQLFAKQIAEHQDFRQWYISESSSIIFVNANSDGELDCPPTSYLGALMISNLESNDVLVLRFCCSQHTQGSSIREETITGPLLLLRTILAQMINLRSTEQHRLLRFLKSDDIEAMEEHAFRQYLDCCASLLEASLQYHQGIMLIIDGLEYYETKWPKCSKRLIKAFEKLTESLSSSNRPLKVLIMAQSHCSLFRKFSHVNVIDLPDELDDYASEFESMDAFDEG